MASIFLSHSHKDKYYARRLGKYLSNRGIKVWIDEAELDIGESLTEKIAAAIDEVDFVGVILTKNSVASNWVKKEVSLAMTREINHKKVIILPILHGSCEVPKSLKDKIYADLRNPNSENYRNSLRKIVQRLEGNKAQVSPELEKFVRQIGAAEVFKTPLSHNRIRGEVHKELTLGLDQKIKSALNILNAKREASNKKPHYAYQRYRIVQPPFYKKKQGCTEFILELAEIDFAYLALLNEPDVDLVTKRYVNKLISKLLARIPERLETADPYFNIFNKGLLGLQMVIITSDGYTLFRRRSRDVLEYPESWDVSFSGYCGPNAVFSRDNENQIEIWRTAKYELERELGVLRADPRDIVFTGLHRSDTSGTTVLLGYWKIQSTRDELAANLNEKYPKGATVFDTTIDTEEVYVKNAKNLISKFDELDIFNRLKKAEMLLSNREASLLPAAHASLLLALSTEGKPTSRIKASLLLQ